MLEDLARAAWAVGADDTAAASHGLDQRAGETLVDGRQREDRRARHVAERVVIVAGELDVGGDAELSGQLFERAALGPLAQNHQSRLAAGADLGEGADQRREVLLWREPSDAEHDGGPTGREPGIVERGRRLVVQRGGHDWVVDGADAPGVETELFGQAGGDAP